MNKTLETKRKIVAAVERERRRIGEELHDDLCQTLAGTTLLLETIGKAAAAQKPVPAESFSGLKNALETAIGQTRTLSRRFDPVHLEDAGLMGALHDLSKQIPNGVFICEKPVFIRTRSRALALYRVAQEAVDNAAKHAKAACIKILLEQQDGKAVLEISDNGRGFRAAALDTECHGFDLMRARAESVGGSVKIKSNPGRGTKVICAVPVRA